MEGERVLLGRYELLEQLGRGGMATVYRAFDQQLGREVAVKLFPAGTATDDARRRVEATSLARLSHPNLVSLFDAHLSTAAETPSFLVMELVRGQDLARRLDHGPLPGVAAAEMLADIAEALAVVHAAGLIHRDLKPANVLLAESSVPGGKPIAKLADFGIAHLVGAERLTATGTMMGTAAYLSPEQARGEQPGPAADVYALGLVALESLTGVREYPGTAVESLAARSHRNPVIPPSLPEEWRHLLASMTARDPEQRPSAAQVVVKVRAIAPQLSSWTLPAAEAVAPTLVLGAEPEPTKRVTPAEATVPATVPLNDAGYSQARTRLLPAEEPPRRRSRKLIVLLVATAATAVALIALTVGLTITNSPTPQPTTSQTSPSTPPPTSDTPTVGTPSPTQNGDQTGKGKGKGGEHGKGKKGG